MKTKLYSRQSFNSYKNNQNGIIHHVAVLGVVLLFAVVGVGYIVGTHADATTTTSASASDLDQTDSATQANGSNTTSSATTSCATQATIPLKGPHGGTYWLNPDRYGGGTMCPKNTDGKTDFTVVSGGAVKTNNGSVQAYPDIINGCTSSKCISGSGYPKKVSSIASNYNATVSIHTGSVSGEWDAAYDLWFNKTDHVGPSQGTEILIMLNEKNRGFPNGISKTKVSIDGADWWLLHYTQSANGRSWNFVEFRRASTTNSTNAIKLVPFITKAENINQLNKTWYITGIDSGFEIWGGGIGLGLSGLEIADF